MRVILVGAGGLGSVVGGHLANAGVDVTLVGRRAHVDAIRTGGLRIEGTTGEDLVVREHLTAVTDPSEAIGEFDYFIVAVKAKDTAAALAGAGALTDRIGCALSLQNSVCKDDVLMAWLGKERVIGASITDAGTLIEPGRAVHPLTASVTAYFGELDGSLSDRAEAIAAAFTRAGLNARAVDDVTHVEWEKLAQISIAASWATSTLGTLDATVADGWKTRHGIEHYVQIGKEVLAVYRSLGYEPRDFYAPLAHLRKLDGLPFDEAVAFMEKVAAALRARGTQVRPSMHEDLVRRRTTEADVIIKPFLDAADTQDTAVPTLRAAYRVIKTLEAAIGAS